MTKLKQIIEGERAEREEDIMDVALDPDAAPRQIREVVAKALTHHDTTILTALREEISLLELDDDKDNHEEYCGLYADKPCDCRTKIYNATLNKAISIIDRALSKK